MNAQDIKWQKVYSDLFPNNTAIRVENDVTHGLTSITVVGDKGVEVCYVFGENQAFQVAYALLKSLNMIGHSSMHRQNEVNVSP